MNQQIDILNTSGILFNDNKEWALKSCKDID